MNIINQKVEFVHLEYRTLQFFQGDLKKVDKSEYKKLENSLKAKGTHAVLKMAEIVQKQLENGINIQELCKTFGMEEEEVIRLANRVGIPKSAVIAENSFGKAWQPN